MTKHQKDPNPITAGQLCIFNGLPVDTFTIEHIRRARQMALRYRIPQPHPDRMTVLGRVKRNGDENGNA